MKKKIGTVCLQPRGMLTDSTDLYLEIVAKTVAKAQSNSDFRAFIHDFIYDEANSLEVGVFARMVNLEIDEINFASFLSHYSNQAGVYRDSLFFAKEVIEAIPNLTISFFYENDPVTLQEWSSTLNYLPVFPVVENFYDTIPNQFPAYYYNLNTTTFSNVEDPNTHVIIIQAYENIIPIDMNSYDLLGGNYLLQLMMDECVALREYIIEAIVQLENTPFIIDVDGQIQINPQIEVALLYLSELINLYNELCTDDPGNGGDDPDPECDRDTRECREAITQWRMPFGKSSVKEFCHWTIKYCQIRVYTRYFFRDSQGALTVEEKPNKFLEGRRRHMRKKEIIDRNLPLPMFRYRYKENLHADFYAMAFTGVHPRGGSSRTFGFTVGPKFKFNDDFEITASLSLSFTRTRRDLVLGGDEIYYCDPANGIGTQYTTGSFEFWIKEIEQCD